MRRRVGLCSGVHCRRVGPSGGPERFLLPACSRKPTWRPLNSMPACPLRRCCPCRSPPAGLPPPPSPADAHVCLCTACRQLGLHGAAAVVISGRREAVLRDACAALTADGVAAAHYVQARAAAAAGHGPSPREPARLGVGGPCALPTPARARHATCRPAGRRAALQLQAQAAALIVTNPALCVTPCLQGDVRRYEDCERMAAEAVARCGRLDILVNCAGAPSFFLCDCLFSCAR